MGEEGSLQSWIMTNRRILFETQPVFAWNVHAAGHPPPAISFVQSSTWHNAACMEAYLKTVMPTLHQLI